MTENRDPGTDMAKTALKDTEAFITTWRIAEAGENFILPTLGNGYCFTIDWGDGTTETLKDDMRAEDAAFTHTYGAPGTYRIRISGKFPRTYFHSENAFPEQDCAGDADAKKLLCIEQWGAIRWKNMACAFSGCKNMVLNATDVPDLSGVNTLSNMFENAEKLQADLSGWDTSNVTNMSKMFAGARRFNSDISAWNTAKVKTMRRMFDGAKAFNADVSGWDVSAVKDMAGLFSGAESFDQNVSGWDVTAVTDMSSMFLDAIAFNNAGQPLCWNEKTAKVKHMRGMFWGAAFFNQDVSGWDVSSVREVNCMFKYATTFNNAGQPLIWGNQLSGVTEMGHMFLGAEAFDQDVSGWDVSAVKDMSCMFFESGLSKENFEKIAASETWLKRRKISHRYSGSDIVETSKLEKWGLPDLRQKVVRHVLRIA